MTTIEKQMGCGVKGFFTLKDQKTLMFGLEYLPLNYQSGVWEVRAIWILVRFALLEVSRR